MNIIKTNLQFNSNYETRAIESIKRIILHHSGVSVLQTVETIHNFHKNTRKFAGIGYNFYVRKDGSIYEGRPLNWVGAHAYANNRDTIGICAEGDFNVETMNEVQKNALKELVAYLKQKYNISVVQAHRDVDNTNCPGANYPFEEIANCEIAPAVDERKERIKELQRLLNKLYIKEDEKSLDVDGIIGEKTNGALRRVALNNYTANDLVIFVQKRLIMNGCGVGVHGADGKYGKDTANAVEKFQKMKGLTADKIAGINTIKALL